MVPGYRQLTYVSYKYNVQKVLYLIFTKGTGRLKAGIPYLYKYPDPFSNVSIHPVHFPLVVSKFFVTDIEIDPHNKSRHSDSALKTL